jgi:hypothetical protein
MRWVGHVAYMGEMRNVYKISVGELEGKRTGHIWEGNTRMDQMEIGWECVDRIHHSFMSFIL